MSEPIKGCPQPDPPELVMRADGYHYKSEDVMKESQMIQAFDKWAREEGINSFHLGHCWDAWQAALALNAADRDVMRETLEEERRKFRLETLRTSEQAKLLGEVAEVLRLRHDPGPWSRGCSECDLVERIDELLARPLNVPTPPAEQQGLADLIAALRGGRQCDEEGSEIIMSRQACVEAANFIEGAPTKKDSNNYCLILRELGMEEEGDPVAEVRRLKEKDEHHVSPSARELDMAMAIRRIVSSARRNCEDGSNVLKLANEAWSYLVRQGLEGSPLRDAGIASDSTVEQQGEQEPYGWLDDHEYFFGGKEKPKNGPRCIPLYTHPYAALAALRAKVEELHHYKMYSGGYAVRLNSVLAEIDKLGGGA